MKAVIVILIGLNVVSAFSVVAFKHLNRMAFIEYQQAVDERDELQLEWKQLQLGLSTFGTHGRVESFARERLGMVLPDKDKIRTVVYE